MPKTPHKFHILDVLSLLKEKMDVPQNFRFATHPFFKRIFLFRPKSRILQQALHIAAVCHLMRRSSSAICRSRG